MKNIYQFPIITKTDESIQELSTSEVIYVDFKNKKVITSIIQEDLPQTEEDYACVFMF
jgi:hypothetical protein